MANDRVLPQGTSVGAMAGKRAETRNLVICLDHNLGDLEGRKLMLRSLRSFSEFVSELFYTSSFG